MSSFPTGFTKGLTRRISGSGLERAVSTIKLSGLRQI